MTPTVKPQCYAAVDLGGSSGRVVLGEWDGHALRTREVARFENPYDDDGAILRWRVAQAFESTVAGLREVQQHCALTGARFAGIGVDSWGVDFGLLHSDGVDLDDVRHHRRAGVPLAGRPEFRTRRASRYAITGVFDQSINTSQQLAARLDDGSLTAHSTLLFIPDLWVYLLSGVVGTDPSIASTSQLIDAAAGQWSDQLTAELRGSGLTLPELTEPGTIVGETSAAITAQIGSAEPIPVIRVAGHDTASALAFAPPATPGASSSGLISSGTWSLAGLVVRDPILTESARAGGFTNERAVHGHLMVKNLSGMWLLEESLRSWRATGATVDLAELIAAAAIAEPDSHVIDLADPRLLEPGDMPARLIAMAVESGRYRPSTPAQIARAVFDSLAAAYVSGVREAAQVAGVEIANIRIVGGGSRNRLLCQLTADRSGWDVIAGPAEASALGNLATQLWASKECSSVYDAYEALDRDAWNLITYKPNESEERQ